MVRVFQPLFFYLASCTENQLARHIEFLKAENEMLRKRVPGKRIFLEPAEKKRLIELGQTIGAGVKHLITVVSYGSYLRWIREAIKGYEPKKMGRRKTADELCQLILTMAKENDWGYTRIVVLPTAVSNTWCARRVSHLVFLRYLVFCSSIGFG